MKIDFRQLSPKALWRRQSVRIGAGLTLLGGAIGVIANLSAVFGIFRPDPTPALVADTRVAVESADAKIDEILKLMRTNAALAGASIDQAAEDSIAATLSSVLASDDAARAQARAALAGGDVSGAAAMLQAIAREQEGAAGSAKAAAARSWRDAGAVLASSDFAAAVDAYEKSLALAPGETETQMALAGLYFARSDLAAAEKLWLSVAARAAPASATAGWAMLGRAAVDDTHGQADSARARLRDALELARSIGDAELGAVAAINLGFILRREGSVAEAERMLDLGLSEARRAGNRGYEARALDALGLVAFSKGDPALAVARLEEARRIHEQTGDLRRMSLSIGNLGAIALERGDLTAAEQHLEASVAIGERLGLQSSIAEDLNNLADLALRRNDLALAEARLQRALSMVEANDLNRLRPFVEATAGQLALARGERARACVLWAASVAALAEMRDATADLVRQLERDAGCQPVAR